MFNVSVTTPTTNSKKKRIQPKSDLNIENFNTQNSIILGIDPSTTNIGVGIFNWHDKTSYCFNITSNTEFKHFSLRYSHLCTELFTSLKELKEKYNTYNFYCGIEWIIPEIERTYVAKDNKTKSTSTTVQLAQVAGAVRFILYYLGIDFIDIPPGTLKKATTGKGNANKVEMINYISRRFGDATITTDHEADALAATAYAIDYIKKESFLNHKKMDNKNE